MRGGVNKKMAHNKIKKIAVLNILIMLVGICMPFSLAPKVEAANLTNASIRPDRMAISLTTPHLVVLTPATVGTEASVKITFDAGYDVSAAAATVTGVSAASPYHGLTLTNLPGALTVSVASQEVTVATSDLTVGTTYAFYLTGIVNPGTTGEKVNTIATQTSGPATIDSSRATTYIVTDNGGNTDSDQIVVTASVAPSYTLILGSNSDSVTASTGSIASGTGVSATATTNANNGHIMWIKSATTTGLDSATAASIPYAGTAADGSPTDLTIGTAGVVIDVNLGTNGSGSLAVAAEFDGGANGGGRPDTTFQEIADADGPTTGDSVTILPKVAISTTTEAADDYTGIYTVVGAGDF